MAPWLSQWGLPGLTLMYSLEAMAVPVPIEFPFVLSGFLLNTGVHSYLTLVVATWASSTLGNLLAFLLARRGGRVLWNYLMNKFVKPGIVRRAEDWVNRFGIGAVLFTRWINWGFGLCLWLVGISAAPANRFVPLVLINNFVWACVWVWLSGAAARGMVAAHLPWWVVLFLPVFFLVFGLCMQHRFRHKPRPGGG